jgi:hypothetical protein
VASPVGWRLVLASDINDDGQTDLVWQHTDGRIAANYLIGTKQIASVSIRNGVSAGVWKLIGSSDFNLDTHNDFLFQQSNGKLLVWNMNGTNFLGSVSLRNGLSAGTWKAFAPK